MKRIFCLVAVLGLCACERPKYDVQLACTDGDDGALLVNAKVYENHADLVIKRLSKDLRSKAIHANSERAVDKAWLYNQIPQIDDTIEISVPVASLPGDYWLPGKIGFDLDNDHLTGGLQFTLFHVAPSGTYAPGGPMIMKITYDDNGDREKTTTFGTKCEPVIYPIEVPTKNLTAEQKNCLNYVSSQAMFTDTKTLSVYDEKTGREMHIDKSAWSHIFGHTNPEKFYVSNAALNPDDIIRACDVAARLREYIATHIDAEAIPEPKDVESLPHESETTITCADGAEVNLRCE